MCAQIDLVRLALVRIDDRLLHGQVVFNWVRSLRPRRIALPQAGVVDEAERSLWRASLAPDIDLWVGLIDAAPQALLHDPAFPPSATMVLLRTVRDAHALFVAGVPFAALNLGCLGAATGRLRVGSQMHLSMQEWEILRCLEGLGVEVHMQSIPSERAVGMSTLVRRMRRGAR